MFESAVVAKLALGRMVKMPTVLLFEFSSRASIRAPIYSDDFTAPPFSVLVVNGTGCGPTVVVKESWLVPFCSVVVGLYDPLFVGFHPLVFNENIHPIL